MQESDWRYVVDVILFVCLGGMTLIGVLLGLVIPAGPVAAESAKYFLGLHRHQWGNIHAYLSIVFIVLMVVHIVLNWKWVKTRTRQIFKRTGTPALVATGAAPFLVLFLFWAGTPKDSDKYREYGRDRHDAGYAHREASSGLARLPGGIAGNQKTPGGQEYPAPLLITGRTTLSEIEHATGLSGRSIADTLGLPPTVPLNEPLGRLRRQYGFEIEAVRNIADRMFKVKN
jgi:Domain of unknown function (DUF4405)